MTKLRKRELFAIGVIFAISSILIVSLLLNIFERKTESQNVFFKVVDLNDETDDPAIWGKNFPLQYADYLKTVDQVRTRFGGSEAVPHAPTKTDPRQVVSQSKIKEDPRLVTMWKGYAFAKDFREERGHAFMLEDQMFTERQNAAKQPGTCLHCHASVYLAYKKAGDGDLTKGFEKLNPLPYAEARAHVKHPVACIDCHKPDTMELRVTRPAFIEGIRAFKATQGIVNFDVNTMATQEEKRVFVCAQCHVEYYFKGTEKRLVYPWGKGLKVEQILSYYDDVQHKDWTHEITGANVLKAQHPEFEIWSQGTHAQAGVSCVDCHMPYKRVGAHKITDHHVRSPLLNINHACMTCHKVSETELRERVDRIQTSFVSLKNTAMNALVDYINDLGEAKAAGIPAERLKAAHQMQKEAQFMIDFVEAENSTGFHAPQETMRVLGESIDRIRRGEKELSKTRSAKER